MFDVSVCVFVYPPPPTRMHTVCRRTLGRELEDRNTAGNSTDDSSQKSAKMLKYDEEYSFKSRAVKQIDMRESRNVNIK